jgi:hypothetical protein
VVVVVGAGPVVVESSAGSVVVVSTTVETVVDVSLPEVQATTARASARYRERRRSITIRLSAWIA